MADLTSQAWELMTLGMGTVFIFLALLVLAVSAMSRALARFADAPGTLKTTSGAAGQQLAINTNSRIPSRHRQAIELAIAQHRKRR